MRLLTYEDLGVRRVGIYVGEKIADLSRVAVALGHPPLPVESMRDLIGCWDRIGSGLRKIQAEAETKAKELSSILIAPEDIRFLRLFPILRRTSCVSDSITKTMRRRGPERGCSAVYGRKSPPYFFHESPTALIGHGKES